jgi:DNA polymerase-1
MSNDRASELNQKSDRTKTSPLFILIDGHSLAFRAYYAFAVSRQGLLRTSTGIPTSICFGFINSLLQVIDSQQPQYLAIAFDRGELTFRHEADANYKATRKETPEDFIPDLKNLQELLLGFNLQIVSLPGYEADDVIGTMAKQASEAGYKVKIVSGDRDLFQLVEQDKIGVLYIDRNSVKSASVYREFAPIDVEEKLGVQPQQVVDYKALCGDKSDNIPGVRGIGEKTAVKLLQEYGSLEGIYNNLDLITGATKKKLEEGTKDAEHSRHLAQIVIDAPIQVELENCHLQGFDPSKVKPLLEKLELKTLLKKLDKLQHKFGGKTIEIESISHSKMTSQQLSLFERESSNKAASDEEKNELFAQNLIKIAPQIIDERAKLNNLVDLLKKQIDSNHPVAWDTETTSLNPREAQLVGIGCCWGEKTTEMAYIPNNHTEDKSLEKTTVIEALRSILESEKYPKVFQNTKFDRTVFLQQGINLAGVVFDTMLASYVIHPEASHKLSDLCDRYLTGIRSLNYEALGIPKGKHIGDLAIERVASYCGMDAYATFMLVQKLKAQLEKTPELYKLLIDIELPLEAVLTAMEVRGVRIDVDYLKALSQQLEKDLAAIEQQAYQEAGEKFNLGSPKQLSELLFDKLQLNRKKSRKIKTGYSTDRATLEKFQGDHPVIDKILEHRTLSKLKSTYVDALPALVSPVTQRVHTDFNQTVTTTGRLSSSNPNLQNIPIRTEFSRKIRQAFIPERNWLLVAADYSQIELRILAHLSQEPILIEAYRQSQDVHGVTAKLLFEKEKITSEERNLGKTINFGVIYGMGAQRFARTSGFSIDIGKKFIEKYRQQYSRVFNYLETMKKEAIALGYVTTIFGRRRYFDFTSESLQRLRGSEPKTIDLDALKLNNTDAQLLRAAANAPIQGSSADIIKIAMINMQKSLANYQAKLLLQVHDELVFEVPPDEWKEIQTKIKSAMEKAVSLSVPLLVEVRAGNNWMEAK